MELTEKQKEALINSDFDFSFPVPLNEADLTKPFVYDRKWGVFYVYNGYHQAVMSLLFAFHNGFDSRFGAMHLAEAMNIRFNSRELADEYLKTIEGTAYASSMRDVIYAGKKFNLTPSERKFFGEVEYLFEE